MDPGRWGEGGDAVEGELGWEIRRVLHGEDENKAQKFIPKLVFPMFSLGKNMVLFPRGNSELVLKGFFSPVFHFGVLCERRNSCLREK